MQLNYSGGVKISDITPIERVKPGTVVSTDPGMAETTAKESRNVFIVSQADPCEVELFDPKTGDVIPVAKDKKVRVLEGCLHYRECQSQSSVDRALKG